MAFNGSPRKDWNTATLLNKALEGAASKGATTELIHLYDLNYKGCISCFACNAKRVFLEPPDRSTESHWRTEIRAGGAGPRAIEANTNIKSHLS